MNRKIQHMAVFIEFLAGSGLAIFFHWVLDYKEAAYIIFAVGILLSLVTWLLREEIEKTREELREQYLQAHEIPEAIARITDPECQTRASELMTGTKRTLALLQQGYIPLDDTEFYLEGAKLADQATRSIKAVDPLTSGWGSRGAMLNFYQSNLRALDRGVRITRIFVVGKDELIEPDVQKVLLAQYNDDIDVRIVYRDELPVASDISGRDTNSSCDFAIYDDQSVTDVFIQPGKYFGRKTSQQAEVEKYLRLYELIEHSAQTISINDEQVLLAGEALAVAS
ncbi:hypothetical protein [Geomobilimonas luticola]|uniref:Uncharacterized protein n=1 Tax=Geomobilimonas luticola TaxID=1114878 RepID=A0ABS5SGX5_9BACT|nr:hypothetical protein [Geomobilimonas luticola]MBT0654618.1 hypothetical protein [Geomobilimonas luticola]